MSTPPQIDSGQPTPPARSDEATAKPAVPSPRLVSGTAAQPVAMDARLTTIQPGGGIVMSIELAWGRLRRWYLRTFRRGYVKKMAESRQGDRGSLPFDPIDPRDLKYYRNQATHWWADSDDPFAWRDSLGFIRVGLAELILIGGLFLALAAIGAWLWWPLAIPMLVLAGLVAWFFRNPIREIPEKPGTIVSPADGKLVQIEHIEDPELGACVQFGIFLSILNVHANRASLPGRVVAVKYRPGKFLNALRPESAKENENLDVIMVADEAPAKMFRIRQITGQFARRIVCWVRPGDVLSRGEMFGMIKLGSRTELVVPAEPGLEIVAQIGDKIAAGRSVLGYYRMLEVNSTARHPAPDDSPRDQEANG